MINNLRQYAVIGNCDIKYGSNVFVLTRSLVINQDISDMIFASIDKINFSPFYLMNTPFGSLTCKASSIYTDISYLALSILFHFILKNIEN